jgi:hypothetical protein
MLLKMPLKGLICSSSGGMQMVYNNIFDQYKKIFATLWVKTVQGMILRLTDKYPSSFYILPKDYAF